MDSTPVDFQQLWLSLKLKTCSIFHSMQLGITTGSQTVVGWWEFIKNKMVDMLSNFAKNTSEAYINTLHLFLNWRQSREQCDVGNT